MAWPVQLWTILAGLMTPVGDGTGLPGSAPLPVQIVSGGNTASGTLTTVAQTVAVPCLGASAVGVEVSADNNVTLVPEATIDGVTWNAVLAFPVGTNGVGVASITAAGAWTIPCGGFAQVRLRVSVAGGAPSATVALAAGQGDNLNSVIQALQSAVAGVCSTAATFYANGQQAPIGLTVEGALIVANRGTPGTQTASSSGNKANAAATATLTPSAVQLAWLSGFQITAGGATAAGLVTGTITGLVGGTQSFTYAVPAGAAVGATPLIVTFPAPIPATAVNTPIVVTLPALGAGNLNACVSAQGYLF